MGAAPSTSAAHWEDQYLRGGNSGPGSRGRLAAFKAEVLNRFVADNGVRSVVEFGCGDGSQLALADYPKYLGLDVSKAALEICRVRFQGDKTKIFARHPVADNGVHDLALSIDVIFHLVEDEAFESYMRSLFRAAGRFVIIYSSNVDGKPIGTSCRRRAFTRWVDQNEPAWRLQDVIRNPYPYDWADPHNTSFCDFYVYARVPLSVCAAP